MKLRQSLKFYNYEITLTVTAHVQEAVALGKSGNHMQAKFRF